FVSRGGLPVALAWVLVLIAGVGVGGEVCGRLGTGSGLRDDAESVVVSDLVARVSGSGTEITGLLHGRRAADPAFPAEGAAAVGALEAMGVVQRVVGPWAAGRAVRGDRGAQGTAGGGPPDNPLIAEDRRAVSVRGAVGSRL